MAGVFISYRREDAPGHAGRVYDRVRARFGADVVFMDVTAIDAGADFVEAIEQAVGACDVLLAIIGPQWAGAKDNAGRRRLENSTDFIRLEVAGALKRNVRVVPVLVDDATLPASADLPDDLQPLLRRNAAELRDARWDADIDQLLASLERIVKPREEPLRLEAAPRSRWLVRGFAVLAVVALGVGGAMFGPRAWAPTPGPTTPTTTASTASPAVTTPAAAAQPPAAAAEKPREAPPSRPTAPDVVGRSLPEAREILRRAGVDLARVLYRDDRTKAIDLVVVQTDMRTSANSPPAVALTAVARAAVVISHRPEDADLARGLLGALMSSKATAGLAMRTVETLAVRTDAAAQVRYSDDALASIAADIAKDATEWLQRTEPGRPPLTASSYPKVVSRTLAIGLPERGSTSSSLAPLPDVRGLSAAEARRKLLDSGVKTIDYTWTEDRSRKPTEVLGQTTVPGRTPGSVSVVLECVARSTLFVEYVESDRLAVERFARDLSGLATKLGIVLRLQPTKAVKEVLIGKVFYGEGSSREAGTIAAFASDWLMKQLGRPVPIKPATDNTVDSRTMFFGVPLLQVPRR